jgi:hypothetical protein
MRRPMNIETHVEDDARRSAEDACRKPSRQRSKGASRIDDDASSKCRRMPRDPRRSHSIYCFLSLTWRCAQLRETHSRDDARMTKRDFALSFHAVADALRRSRRMSRRMRDDPGAASAKLVAHALAALLTM